MEYNVVYSKAGHTELSFQLSLSFYLSYLHTWNLCWISFNYTYGFNCCSVFIHQKVTWWWKGKERWVGSWIQIWKLYLDIFIGEQSHKETNTSTCISNTLCYLQGHICLQYNCVVSLYLKSTRKTHPSLAQWSGNSTAAKGPILSLSLGGQAPLRKMMWKHVEVMKNLDCKKCS